VGRECFLDSIPRKIGVRGRRAHPNPTQVEELVELLRRVHALLECAEALRAVTTWFVLVLHRIFSCVICVGASLRQFARERGEQGL